MCNWSYTEFVREVTEVIWSVATYVSQNLKFLASNFSLLVLAAAAATTTTTTTTTTIFCQSLGF
jgi:high-affinity Fe2+/Pb2+ permease